MKPLMSFGKHPIDGRIQNIEAHKVALERIRESVSKKLFEFIQHQFDPVVQNKVQNFRRNFYNGRNVKQRDFDAVLEVLPESLVLDLEDVKHMEAVLRDEEQHFTEEIQSITATEWRELQVAAQNQLLQKGIVLSAFDFLNEVIEFSNRKIDRITKRDLQTGFGILKYVTRFSAKTSPFSFFTSLWCSEHQRTGGCNLDIEEPDETVIGHTRLNNLLFKYLKDLLTNYPEVCLRLRIRLNPTVVFNTTFFSYLVNNNNVESFQQLASDPILNRIVEILNGAQKTTLGEFVMVLIEEVETSQSDLEQYLKQLIDYGFIEYNLGISGLDPEWDVRLVELASTDLAGVPCINELSDVLVEMRKTASVFHELSPVQRKTTLTAVSQSFQNVCQKIQSASGQSEVGSASDSLSADPQVDQPFRIRTFTQYFFKPRQIFYDDSVRKVSAFPPLSEPVESLAWLCQNIDSMNHSNREMRRLRNYFVDRYGVDAVVPFLKLYQDYYRDVKKAIEAFEKRTEINSNGSPGSEGHGEDSAPPYYFLPEFDHKDASVLEWQHALGREVLKDNKDQSFIEITPRHIEAVNKELDFALPDYKQNSFGAFVQFYVEGGKVNGVVNSVFAGYGKLLGRFLHILPEKALKDTRLWNMQFSEQDVLHIENTDASCFNANIHPAMMPFEIQVPGGQNNLPESGQIKVAEFVVKLNEAEDELALVHAPSGKRSFIYDLSFQGSKGRSNLFQLLNNFTKIKYPLLNTVTAGVNQHVVANNTKEIGCKKYPRITFAGNVVLQRRAWFLNKSELPFRQNAEDDGSYFLKVRTWARHFELPDHVFIYVDPFHFNRAPGLQGGREKAATDDYKPQYINFNSPVMVLFLERIIRKVPTALKIEEMLPQPDQIKTRQGDPWVTECLVQWYNDDCL